jgi:uncharacterized protein YajQ (UPF0234 family)
MADSSFDVVSKIDRMELDNAINQAIREIDTRFVVVPRIRGQQLKDPAQLDGWLRDGSAAAVSALCDWV